MTTGLINSTTDFLSRTSMSLLFLSLAMDASDNKILWEEFLFMSNMGLLSGVNIETFKTPSWPMIPWAASSSRALFSAKTPVLEL